MSDPERGTAQFIVPVGIDFGRVKSGIKYWHGIGRIPNLLYLPVSKEWIGDPEYERRVLKPMKSWLKDLPRKYGFKTQFQIDPIENIDEFDRGFGYLMGKMSELRGADPYSTIYIDSTSAPKTWLLAAVRVIPYFPRVVIYHVKSRMTPKDYSKDQISDEGGDTKTVNVGTGCNPILEEIASGSGKHRRLFEELFQRSGTSRESIRTEEFIDPFLLTMGKKYEGKDRENVHKAVTSTFSDMATAGQLVDVLGPGGKKKVKLTDIGSLVAQSLFTKPPSTKL